MPGLRKCTAYLRPGAAGLPLGLASSEGLGVAARIPTTALPGRLRRYTLTLAVD